MHSYNFIAPPSLRMMSYYSSSLIDFIWKNKTNIHFPMSALPDSCLLLWLVLSFRLFPKLPAEFCDCLSNLPTVSRNSQSHHWSPSHKYSHLLPHPVLSHNSSAPRSLNLWWHLPSDQLNYLNQHPSAVKRVWVHSTEKNNPEIINANTNLVHYIKNF